ncbi:MAG: hypothetical protein ACP5G8_09210, partial [Athalassotoga sp.]
PEWKKYEKVLEKNRNSRQFMNFKDFFSDDSDKKFLKEKLGKDPFENIKHPVAEIELEEEEESRQILDC